MHGRGVRLATPLPACRCRVQFFFFFFFSRRFGPIRSVSAETHRVRLYRRRTDVAERGADGGGGLPGAEPSVDLQLSLPSFLVSNEIEIQVQVLEISDKLATWAFHLDDLSVHLNLDPIWDVHGLRWQDGLHGVSLSNSSCASLRMKNNEVVAAKNPKLYVCIYSRNKKKKKT